MPKIYVPLDKDEAKALIALSICQKRDARMQAAFLVRRGLEQLGCLESADAKYVSKQTRKTNGK